MRTYGCYFMDSGEHIVEFERWDCEDDEEAWAAVETRLQRAGHASAEIWKGRRRVAQLWRRVN